MVFVENSFYLLALLNPASKVMFLATYEPKLERKEILELSWKSSVAALLMLIVLAGAGEFVLSKIFRVDLYSLKITGGIILFIIGLAAVREGRFINSKSNSGLTDFTDLSLVPLAAPLIAGPGTIAASISGAAQFGLLFMVLSLTAAILINFIIMLFASGINRFLEKLHLTGPLIRLTGLIISAVAVQMVIVGIREAKMF